jgi:hypothetical protein
MESKTPIRPLTPAEVSELVRGIGPVDWVQVELIRNLPPEKRILPAMQAMNFARAIVRGTLSQRFPELSLVELNMKVLSHFTTVRMDQP